MAQATEMPSGTMGHSGEAWWPSLRHCWAKGRRAAEAPGRPVSEVSEVSTSKGQGSWGPAGVHLGVLPRKSGSRVRATKPAGRKGGGTLMRKCVWQGHFLVGRKEPTEKSTKTPKRKKASDRGTAAPPHSSSLLGPFGDNTGGLEMWGCSGRAPPASSTSHDPSPVTAAPARVHSRPWGARTPPSLGLLCSVYLLERASPGQIKGRGRRWGHEELKLRRKHHQLSRGPARTRGRPSPGSVTLRCHQHF